MTKNNWIIPSLIIAGLASVALSLYISVQSEKQKSSSHSIARVELNLGKVYILRKSNNKKELLTKKSQLFKLDSLETSADGDATLEFESAYRIRVQENSLITLDEEGDRVVLIIKRGDVQVENFGHEGGVYISHEGTRWEATDYENVFKKQAPPETLPSVVATDTSTPIAAHSKEGLTSEYIQDVLKTARGSFFKCYTQVLQKTPGVVGQASITFTIEKSGKIFNAEISSCSINDADFKKCLIDSIRRVEFTSFEGEPITTVFPIKFE